MFKFTTCKTERMNFEETIQEGYVDLTEYNMADALSEEDKILFNKDYNEGLNAYGKRAVKYVLANDSLKSRFPSLTDVNLNHLYNDYGKRIMRQVDKALTEIYERLRKQWEAANGGDVAASDCAMGEIEQVNQMVFDEIVCNYDNALATIMALTHDYTVGTPKDKKENNEEGK